MHCMTTLPALIAVQIAHLYPIEGHIPNRGAGGLLEYPLKTFSPGHFTGILYVINDCGRWPVGYPERRGNMHLRALTTSVGDLQGT